MSSLVLTHAAKLALKPLISPLEQARRELEEARRKGNESAEEARAYWSKMLPDAVAAFDEAVSGKALLYFACCCES